mgnify:CR=1 FL=1
MFYIVPICTLMKYSYITTWSETYVNEKIKRRRCIMDIYEALKKLNWKKKAYFVWRHDLEFDKTREKNSEERMCEILKVKTLNSYIKWENSAEYLRLLNLYLETKFANDLEQIYATTQQKAVEGDEKAIKLLLDIQKQISNFNKDNSKKNYAEKESVYDDLEL